MGFGLDLDVKVEVPKVEVPKVDVGAAVSGAVNAATSAVSGAVSSVAGAVDSVAGAVSGAVKTATDAVSSLASVAGAIAEVAVSFTGAIEDLVLEPHIQLDANASFGDTQFEKGPVWIRLEMTEDEAKASTDSLHLSCESGAYDKMQRISNFADTNATSVVVVFEEAPMNETFTLELVSGNGDTTQLFSGVAYGHMRKSKDRCLADPAS